MLQNETNGLTPTRRIVLSGGLSAVLWRLGARARAEAPAAAAQGILDFEAAPARGFKSPRLRPKRRRPAPMPARFRARSSGSGKARSWGW